MMSILFRLLKWAGPGGSAIPGQPAAGEVQATTSSQVAKIGLTFWVAFATVSDVKLIRTDTTL